MTKKILSILLALVMVVAMAPVSVFAEDNILDYLTYEINDGEVTITGCDTSISGDVVIPDTIEGYPVTLIGDEAFYHCGNLISIKIPDGVTSIGDSAFLGCGSLTSITIPDSVTEIGFSSFESCTSLENIDIPDSVTFIGEGAFQLCTSLKRITIPNGVTVIRLWTFTDCTSLESVIIPNSVTGIDTQAFENCTSLTDITIPDSVTAIGAEAFYKCTSLASITIPDSVTYIGWDAFEYCTSLTSITIPHSVTSIDEGAFKHCDSLESITILNPDCLIEYHENTIPADTVIYGCSDSTANEYANNYNRTFVAIDDYIAVVTAPTCTEEGYTTYTCTICGYSYTDDYVDVLGHTMDDGVVTSPTCTEQGYTTYTCTICGDSYVDDYVAAEHTPDDGVVTAPTCTEQGYTTYTCNVCGNSYKDDYVSSLGHVDENADSECDVCDMFASGDFYFSVTDAEVGETVEVTIGTDFDGFKSGSFKIYYDQQYLEYVSCKGINQSEGLMVFAGIPQDYTAEDDIINSGMMVSTYITGTRNFITLTFNVLKAENSTLSVSVNDWDADSTPAPANARIAIGVHEHDYAEVVTAPTCVEEGYTTYTCSVCGDSYVDNYDYSYVPHNFNDDMYCDACGEYALFYGIENDSVVIYGCDYLFTGSVVIPEAIEGYPVTCIDSYAFLGCTNITDVTIPSSVTVIGPLVFGHCENLERIVVDENNQNYSSDENGILYNKDKTEIITYPCKNANVEYVMPDSVTTISIDAFEESAIESVSVSNNVTEIVYSAFAGCASLKSVDIPDSVKSISARSFVNCDSLKEITVPESVTSIDEYAIGYCWDSNPYEYKIVDGFTIYSYAGSAAETYANENGITFVALCKHETTVVKNAVEATCTADGYTGDVHCEKCDELLTNGEAVAATGHTEEIISEVPATYAATGLTEGKKCSVCGEILVEQTEIPMLINPNLTTDSADITVTDKLANLAPEMSVETVIKSVENKKVLIVSKDGAELVTDALVGTGSKVQVLDNDGNVLSEYEVMVKSDVDGNGKITPADARLALRASANLDKLEGVYETAANYDGEKTVSTSDARMILRKSAGLE